MSEEIYPPKIILEYSGWVELSHETTMQYIGEKEHVKQIITVLEWSKFPKEQQDMYILENAGKAIADGHEEWTELNLTIKSEEDDDDDDDDDQRFYEEIRANIKKTVAYLKMNGTVGCSVLCLMQQTPTPKINLPMTPELYRSVFETEARNVASNFLTD
jgi:hypothetical protein